MKDIYRLLKPTIIVFAMVMSVSSAVGTAPSLGGAASFAVLAGTTVTNTGPSQVIGDVGVSPGTAITGLTPEMVVGTIYAGGGVAAQAQADALAAFNDLASQACDTILTGQDLGGLTLTPGVYCFASSAQLTGTLTLNALGDPNAVFIFKIGSTLTTASNSSVLLINGANPCNVFFQVGSSATLGTDTVFVGTILASASITLNTRTSLRGRALALDGAVTLDTNGINNVCALGTTAASVSISGRVVTAEGRGIRDAQVWMIDSEGSRWTVITSSLGYYSFTDVEAGNFYILGVASRRYRFETRAVSASDSIANFDFLAQE
ncbi:hypothetical protein BH20ACI2_BH20ACI2_00880 [soil metagenome]